jgi:hypothetical protein
MTIFFYHPCPQLVFVKMAELEARGITVRDVAPADFIAAYALHLKNSDKFEVISCFFLSPA